MEDMILQARLLHVVFYNAETGYFVGRFQLCNETKSTFTATGFFHSTEIDSVWDLHGSYKEHPRYGLQFNITSYERVLKNDITSLIQFFSSSRFPGIGKQSAKKIVDTLGHDCIEKIQKDPAVLLSIPDFPLKKVKIIEEGILEEKEDDISYFFSKFGIGVQTAKKIENIYGNNTIEVIKQNPYQLLEEVDGVGFKTADKLARDLSVSLDDPRRIKAIIVQLVQQWCNSTGDTYIEIEKLYKKIQKEFHDLDVEAYLQEILDEGILIKEDKNIYYHKQFEAEKYISSFLFDFPYVEQPFSYIETLGDDIENIEDELHIEYEKIQKQAFHNFFLHPFSIITGGPGTGKTTIVQGLISLYKKYYPLDTIALCAPTGRASKRLSEICQNVKVSTIHSLLHWDLESNTFLKNEKELLDCDLLVIDEFSMVDQQLFQALLKSAKLVKKILLIGDENQLASVGCGSVLKDLITFSLFPLTRLEKIFRQKEGSDVITLAHEINEENVTVLEQGNDIAFFSCENYEVKDILIPIVSNALEKGYSIKDIQVLAPMYGGVAGIDALNNTLQKVLNPQDGYKDEIKVGYRVFRVGDKILQLKNQPDENVYNGDIGEIIAIEYADENALSKNVILADFDGNFVEYSGEQISNITHAYCISIHKAQGSEYPIVIMPVVKDYAFMLSKRLLYTGVTRAKKSLVLLGSKEVFLKYIHLQERHIRKTTLKKHILEKFE